MVAIICSLALVPLHSSSMVKGQLAQKKGTNFICEQLAQKLDYFSTEHRIFDIHRMNSECSEWPACI